MEVDATLIFLRTMEVLDLYIEMDMEKAHTTTNSDIILQVQASEAK